MDKGSPKGPKDTGKVDTLEQDNEFFKHMIEYIPAYFYSPKNFSAWKLGRLEKGYETGQKEEPDEDVKAQKKRKRDLKKMKQKKKSRKQKGEKMIKNEVTPKKAAPKKTSPQKPIFNKDGNMVFSKFDFSTTGQSEDLKKDLPTGKNYKKLLEKVEKSKKKYESLKEVNEEAAQSFKKKSAWQNAILRAEGVKVKDNPELLKKALKKQEKMKKHSMKQWEKREDFVNRQQARKQRIREKNIKAKKQGKVNKKMKKFQKKGHILPGF